MIASKKPKDYRKQKGKERNVRDFIAKRHSAEKSKGPVSHENDECQSDMIEKNAVENDVPAEIETESQGNCENVYDFANADNCMHNAFELEDEGCSNFSLLEDEDALDVLLLLNKDNENKTSNEELLTGETIKTSEVGTEVDVDELESEISDANVQTISYANLLNDVQKLTLSEVVTPTAPDCVPNSVKIEEPLETAACPIICSSQVVEKEKSVKQELNVIELEDENFNESLKALSEEELSQFYCNTELKQTHEFINEFIKDETDIHARVVHPFYELLSNYLKANNSLQTSKNKIIELDKKLETHINQVWTVWNDIELSNVAKCADGNSISFKHKYMKADFNQEVFNNFKTTLSDIKSILFDSFKKESFNCLRYKIKIEQYIHSLFTSCTEFTNLSDSSCVSMSQVSSDSYFQQCLNNLKISIGILFMFQRKQNVDMNSCFLQESRQWLTNLVSLLIRVGNWKDHLFLLNHVLRCPGGVGKWASSYIQFPKFSCMEPFSNPVINHMMAVMSILLKPIEQRDDFMNEWNEISGPDENSWVVIDSDEEDNDTLLSSPLRENDLVMLLNQVPLKELFSAVLGLTDEKLDPLTITVHHMMKLFSFSSDFIKILHNGLQLYSTRRYKQFAKRLGRLILHIIEYVTYELDIFLSNGPLTNAQQLESLQVEYDNFFMKSTRTIYSSQIHGTWQYLTVIPYHRASSSVILKLYSTLQLNDTDANDILKINLSDFEEKFQKYPESEQFYLLSAFISMALARDLTELKFIKTVLHQLLYIGFLGNLTKDQCYKNVKSLLNNLCSEHPYLMSEIIRIQNENFTFDESRDQSLSIYLWKELPVRKWKPEPNDLETLSSWLMKPMEFVQSELARLILMSLNYGVEQGELFLSTEAHHTVAHIILKASACVTHEKEMNVIRNVSNFVGLQEPEQNFQLWSWNVLLKLRLHLFDQAPASVVNSIRNLNEHLKHLPELSSLKELHELVQQKNPIASFIAIMTTTTGHSVPLIHIDGFALIENIIRARKSEAAIACIQCMILMFLECPESLYKCQNFTSTLSSLINADYSYLSLSKNFKGFETPGPILTSLQNMIQNQICSCAEYGINRSRVIVLWIKSLTKLPLWIQEPGVIYLLDSLCKSVYFDKYSSTVVKEIFVESLLENSSSSTESKSSLASFVNWMNKKSSIPTLLARGYNGDTVWFFLKIMEIEQDIYENKNFLWHELLKELHANNDKKTSVDNCLKKACSYLRIPVRTSETLIIYRLCYQILETKITHPLIILLWQKFVVLYFYRVPFFPNKGSVGDKFFHGIINQNLFKRLKQRLKETSENFNNLHKQCSDSDERGNYYLRCSQVLHVFQLWLDEPKLHEAGLNLHMLPLQFDPELLEKVLQRDDSILGDYVDYLQVQNEVSNCVSAWQGLMNRKTRNMLNKSPTVIQEKSFVEKIQDGLMRYENPLPPPNVNAQKIIPVGLTKKMFLYSDSKASCMKPSLKNILKYTEYHVQNLGEHTGLICDLQDLIQKLYKQKLSSITLKEHCGGYVKVINGAKINFNCSGPAVITLSFEASKMDKKNMDLFNLRFKNFTLSLHRSLLPLLQELGISVVTLEKAAEQLVTEYNYMKSNTVDGKLFPNVKQTGIDLFYILVEFWSESLSMTPFIETLFENILNVLGKTFIEENPLECDPLLDVINRYPKLIDKLNVYFNPNICSVHEFIELYDKVKKLNSNIRLVLLSRFNLDKWLDEKKPRYSERSLLISEIFSGLKSIGSCDKDFPDLVKLFNSHLQQLIMYDFPEHYGETLNLLLEGSESQAVPVSTWFVFINSLAPEGIHFIEGKCEGFEFEPGQVVKKLKLSFTQFATHQKLLSLSEIRETIIHLSKTFKTDRLRYGLFGLYPKYRCYIEPILIFCGLLSHSYVAETLKLDLGSLSVRIADQLWPLLKRLYSPWLVPYRTNQEKAQTAKWIQELTGDKCVLLPWTQSDVSIASYCCSIFIESIRFVLDTLPGVNSLLSHVWFFYVTNYAHIQVKDHVHRVIHKYLLQLPWSTFFPTLQDTELMVKVVEHFIPMAHSLLGSIFADVRWIDIVNHYSNSADVEALTKLHVHLLHLFVKLPCEPSLKQNNEVVFLLTEAKNFSWHLVDSKNYDYVLHWFVMSCDPRIVLMDKKSEYYNFDSLILDILRTCAGCNEAQKKLHPTTVTKRLMYIRANNKWLTTANSRFKCKDSVLFKSAVYRILNEIEGTTNQCVSESSSADEIALLLTEFLELFKKEELSSVVEEVMMNWLSSKRSNFIIYGLLRSIALSAVTPLVFGNIAEACLNCYFDSNDDSTWSEINSKFVMYASGQCSLQQVLIANDNLLTVNAILLKQAYENANLLDKRILLNDILQPLKSAKRSEAVEPKLVLMIVQAFEIADSVSGTGEAETTSILSQLSTLLHNISRDTGSGLLSKIGLKKNESFSVKFRFICLIASVGIMNLFQKYYPNALVKVDEKILNGLDQANTNKEYQSLSQYTSAVTHEINQLESIKELIEVLKNFSLKIFNKNFLK